MMLTPALVSHLRETFVLDWHGIHGAPHWARVRLNGLSLAPHTGANPEVIEWFAFLHDIRRLDDGHDEHHGARAAEFAATLRGEWIHLSAPDFERLHYACTHHSSGLTEADVTVQTCWDADRLDLGRVGIRPAPRYLCTAAAREPETIARAYAASTRRSRR